MKTNIHFLLYLSRLLVEKITIRILCSVTFLENYAVYENVEKYCIAVRATDDNMAQAHCMLGT
jgi:hypothetical protein